jgi:hypothetical protein
MAEEQESGIAPGRTKTRARRHGKPSALLDIQIVYGGDNLEQLAKLARSLPNGLPGAPTWIEIKTVRR